MKYTNEKKCLIFFLLEVVKEIADRIGEKTGKQMYHIETDDEMSCMCRCVAYGVCGVYLWKKKNASMFSVASFSYGLFGGENKSQWCRPIDMLSYRFSHLFDRSTYTHTFNKFQKKILISCAHTKKTHTHIQLTYSRTRAHSLWTAEKQNSENSFFKRYVIDNRCCCLCYDSL